MVYQADAFPTEEEAQKVLNIWRAEGRPEPLQSSAWAALYVMITLDPAIRDKIETAPAW